jgi:hypothetical protein
MVHVDIMPWGLFCNGIPPLVRIHGMVGQVSDVLFVKTDH